MIYALLIATASVGGLPLPYADILCETGRRETEAGRPNYVRKAVRNFPLADQVAVLQYCVAYNRGQAAELRRTELPESTD